MSIQQSSFAETLEKLYHAAALPELWPQALTAVADHAGAMGAVLAYHDFVRSRGFLVTGRLRDDLSSLYVNRYGDNHYSRAITRRPMLIPFAGRALVEPKVARASEFHADIFAPQRIVEQVMMGVAPLMTPHSTGGVAVMLDERRADAADWTARRLARLGPHLANVLNLSIHTARLQQASATVTGLVSAMPGAVFLLDEDGRIVEANAAAEVLLRSNDGMSVADDKRLVPIMARDQRAFASMRARATKPMDAMHESQRLNMRLSRRVGKPLLAVMTPLPPVAFEPWDMLGGRARVMLQIIDPSPQARLDAAPLLRTMFGLTVAEARVAALVGTGMTAPQIAVALSLSVNTIRTHLMRSFDKAGVRSQVALAQLVTSLSTLAA